MHLDGWTIALQTINFAIVVWLLHRFLYRPVLRIIDSRQAEVQRELDAAKGIEDQAREHLSAIEAERNRLPREREAALSAAMAQAQEAAAARHAQAERDAQALLETARRSIASERERALEEAQRVALDLAASLARRLLAELPLTLRAEAWIERMEQHLRSLSAADIAALTHQLGPEQALRIVTATPLPSATAEPWRERLQRVLGEAAPMVFEVDEALIAGAELHFPTAILRFSWQARLAELRSQAGAHGEPR